MPIQPQRVLSIIPPMTQLNTPYPSTAYLTGFLRSRGVDAVQEDLALALVLKLLSRDGLRARARVHRGAARARAHAAVDAFDRRTSTRYRAPSRPTIAFLQGRDPTLAHRIAGRSFLPEGPRFASLDVYVGRRWRRPAGLGLRRARHARPRPPPGHAVPERHRRRAARRGRPALRVRALRRAAGAEPAQLRAAGRRRWPRRSNLVDGTLHELTLQALARHRADAGAGVGALPRRGVRGLSHRAGDQGARPVHRHRARRRLRQHRAARADRAARLRLLRLRHARRRRAARCWRCSSTWHGRRSRSRLVRTFVRDADAGDRALRQLRRARRAPSPRSARPPGTACRWTATCRCSTCSTRCTGCGPTGAGTSSPWRTAATGRSAASATSASTTSRATRPPPRRRWSTASRPSSRETGQTGFHFVDEAAPPKALRALAAELQRRRLAISLVGQHPLREDLHARSCASCSPTAAASPSPAGSRWRPTGC